jgi:HPt (histidine-containing phosphotransfer) domain-containing protein
MIKTEAHSLKSEAATLGLLRLSQQARTLEFTALEIAAADYPAALDRLEALFKLTLAELPTSLAA